MKIILILNLLLTNIVFAGVESISGTINLKGEAPKGVLFIFAKQFDGKMPMPLAVQRIDNPTFPVSFSLSQKNAMMKGIPFKGPFTVTARLSPSGNAMDKSGIQVSTEKKIELGDIGINLILKN